MLPPKYDELENGSYMVASPTMSRRGSYDGSESRTDLIISPSLSRRGSCDDMVHDLPLPPMN